MRLDEVVARGTDIVYLFYPRVVRYVLFRLLPFGEHKEIYIGVNDYTPSHLDTYIFIDGEYIDLSDTQQRAIFKSLDRQVRERYGKGCMDMRPCEILSVNVGLP